MLPEDDTLAAGGRGGSDRDGDCRNNEGPKDWYSPPQRKDSTGITPMESGPAKMGPDRPAACRSGAAKESTPSPRARSFGVFLNLLQCISKMTIKPTDECKLKRNRGVNSLMG
ncbi:UNVERIFIED_CONTAM: hypothetical protein K2H54_013087 [Gekko kuhli]